MTDSRKRILLDAFTYTLIFFVFMGSKFMKFSICGVNLNFARILMVIPAFILLMDAIKNKKIDFNIQNKSLKYCITFFIIWSIYSVITIYKAKDIKSYVIENFFICIGTVDILFFIKYINVKEKAKDIFHIVNIAVFINCIYYLFLYFIKQENIGGFYHNSNDLGTVLILSIPLSIYLIKNSNDKFWRTCAIIEVIIFLVSFINITSRASILGICFAFFMFVLLKIIREKRKIFKNKKRLFYISIGVIFAIIICIFVCKKLLVFEKLIGDLSLTPIENAKSSNEIRTNLIFNGLYFLTKDLNIIFGIGAGNAMYYLRNFSIYSSNNIFNFHNFWMDLLVGYGIFIFIGFIITYIIICKNLYKKVEQKYLKKINVIFLFFMLSFIIASISSSTIITREWIWLVWGIIISYINYQVIPGEKNERNEISK